MNTLTLNRLAARAAIARHSEQHDRARLADDSHDLLGTVLDLLAELGVPVPDGTSADTARTAWL